jgi:hypothetical protein
MDTTTLIIIFALSFVGLIMTKQGRKISKNPMGALAIALVVTLAVGAFTGGLPSMSFGGIADNNTGDSPSATFKVTPSADSTNSSTVTYDRVTKSFNVPVTIDNASALNYTIVNLDFAIERTDAITDTTYQAVTTITHSVPEINNEDTQTAGLTVKQYPVAWRTGYTSESFNIYYHNGSTGAYDSQRVVLTTPAVTESVQITLYANSLRYLDAYESAPIYITVAGQQYAVNILVTSDASGY